MRIPGGRSRRRETSGHQTPQSPHSIDLAEPSREAPSRPRLAAGRHGRMVAAFLPRRGQWCLRASRQKRRKRRRRRAVCHTPCPIAAAAPPPPPHLRSIEGRRSGRARDRGRPSRRSGNLPPPSRPGKTPRRAARKRRPICVTHRRRCRCRRCCWEGVGSETGRSGSAGWVRSMAWR